MIDFINNSSTKNLIAEYLNEKGEHFSYSILSEKVPNKLYRYCELNTYSISNLLKGEITLTNPLIFNDIYDSTMHTTSFQRNVKSYQEINDLASLLHISPIIIDLDKLQKDSIQTDRFRMTCMTKSMRIACLSESNESILMWSHYANNNRGICVEYDLTQTKTISSIYPVIYARKPIDVSDLCNRQGKYDIELATLLSTILKNDVWSYEKEWRILYYFLSDRNLQDRINIINIPTPKTIYLGQNFVQSWMEREKEDRFLLRQFCDYIEENSVQLFFMRNKLLSYELEAVPFDINCLKPLQ